MNVRTREFKNLVIEQPLEVRPRRGDDEPRSAERRAGTAQVDHHESSPIELLLRAPWRLTHDDFRGYPQHIDTLDEIRLDPETVHGPALLARIERQIALLNSELLDLTYTEQITSVGKAFTIVARARPGSL